MSVPCWRVVPLDKSRKRRRQLGRLMAPLEVPVGRKRLMCVAIGPVKYLEEIVNIMNQIEVTI